MTTPKNAITAAMIIAILTDTLATRRVLLHSLSFSPRATMWRNSSPDATHGSTRLGTVALIKMIASVMAALAEFERDLIRERIKSGIAAAKARRKRLGRQPGQ
jgi:Resolvase, N terminal domain